MIKYIDDEHLKKYSLYIRKISIQDLSTTNKDKIKKKISAYFRSNNEDYSYLDIKV